MSLFGPIINNSTDDAKAKAEIFQMDPLGLTYQGKLLAKEAQALTDPKAYIAARNKAITDLQTTVYDEYFTKLKSYQSVEKIPEPQAKKKADAFAKAAWDAGMVAVNEDYPLSAVTIATERQNAANSKDLGENLGIKRTYSKTHGAPRKAPKRAPKKK